MSPASSGAGGPGGGGPGGSGRGGPAGSAGSGGPLGFLPFSAVVAQDEAKLALLLAAVEPRIGGVLLRGEKGSAKTTLARGLASLLPGDARFVELPLGATEDRVVGTLDLAAALTGGEKRFDPGLLHAADGGVLYVDEINLLPDHLVDVLLDVAASGVNRIEREGVSHSHPSRFLLIGSMNPEEGELRPQLLDRFGLAVDLVAPDGPGERVRALRRRLEFDQDPEGVVAGHAGEEQRLRDRLATARPAGLSPEVLEAVAGLCAAVGAEGLRADLTICRAASALAGWEGRDRATVDDARRVAGLALAHRARRDPLDPTGAAGDQQRQSAVERHLGPGRTAGESGGGPPGGAPPDAGSPAAPAGSAPDERAPVGSAPDDRTQGEPATAPDHAPPAAPALAGWSGAEILGRSLPARGRRSVPDPAGSGRRTPTVGSRGRVIGDTAPEGTLTSVAVGATVRRAAARRAATPPAPGNVVEPADIRQAVHQDRLSYLIVIAVDASGSMGARKRLEAAKAVVFSLLREAYVRRDLVSLVAFHGDGAEVLLRPTASVEVARARLVDLPSGGRTPLAAGLRSALAVATSRPAGGHEPLIVVVTDGRATAAAGSGDPLEEATRAAAEIRRSGVRSLVVDVEGSHGALGLGRALAAALGGAHEALGDVDAVGLEQAVRRTALRGG